MFNLNSSQTNILCYGAEPSVIRFGSIWLICARNYNGVASFTIYFSLHVFVFVYITMIEFIIQCDCLHQIPLLSCGWVIFYITMSAEFNVHYPFCVQKLVLEFFLIILGRCVCRLGAGSGRLSWVYEDEMRRVNLQQGDVYRLPTGSVFFLQSNLEQERQKLRIYSLFTNSIQDLHVCVC